MQQPLLFSPQWPLTKLTCCLRPCAQISETLECHFLFPPLCAEDLIHLQFKSRSMSLDIHQNPIQFKCQNCPKIFKRKDKVSMHVDHFIKHKASNSETLPHDTSLHFSKHSTPKSRFNE